MNLFRREAPTFSDCHKPARHIGAALCAIVLVCFTLGFSAPAHAATATYVEPATISAGDLDALSSGTDGAGFNIGLGQTLGILLDVPIGVAPGDSVSIFTLPPSTGTSRAIISFGVYNNGSPTFVHSRKVNGGNSVTVGSLFDKGCSLFGGCDFISITTIKTNKGADGVAVDYVIVNGEVVAVTSPTPEPEIWALMIVGFAGIAWRAKAVRRKVLLRPKRTVRPRAYSAAFLKSPSSG